MSRSRWKTLRERKLAEGFVEPEDVTEARREIRLSTALAKAVYERRTELGLTRAEPAARAGLTQAKVSRIEGSDTVPTHRPRQRRHPSDLHRASHRRGLSATRSQAVLSAGGLYGMRQVALAIGRSMS